MIVCRSLSDLSVFLHPMSRLLRTGSSAQSLCVLCVFVRVYVYVFVRVYVYVLCVCVCVSQCEIVGHEYDLMNLLRRLLGQCLSLASLSKPVLIDRL